jgi:hypothetical protein
MKKLFTLFGIALCFLFLGNSISFGQVTTNSGSGLAPTYPSLAAAITALNSATITSPVVITLTGNETTPAGGYSITQLGGTATNTIIIQGSGSTITAFTPQTSGALNDAIFKIIGGDYITIQNFTMQENASNTTTTAGTNNMTEWGVALLYASVTNGAKNITIQNNTITLNRTYQNSFGIYSNVRHSATAISTTADITAATGANDNTKIYSNNISNVNNGIVIVGSTTAAYMNTGIDIGGTSAGTANTVSNYGLTGAFSGYISVSGSVMGINVNNSLNVNISYNSVTCPGLNTAGTVYGIYNQMSGTAPTTGGPYTNTISHNTLSIKSGVIAGAINGILNAAGSSVINYDVSYNDFNNFGHTVAGTATITCLSSTGAGNIQTINYNTFTNLNVNTTGAVYLINYNNSLPLATSTQSVSNNSIVTGFNKTGAGSTLYCLYTNGSSVASSTKTISYNNFSNITLAGATALVGFQETDGGAPNKTINNNTLSNVTGGTGAITGLTFNYGTANIYSNTFNNITGGGAITVMSCGGSSATLQNVYLNNIYGISSTGASAIYGIQSLASGTSAISNVYRNNIYNLSGSNASSIVYGLYISAGTTIYAYNNFINDLKTPAGNAAIPIAGIYVSGGTTVGLYYNTIYLNATSTGALFGSTCIYASTTTTLDMRNNILVNVSTPAGATGFTTAYRRSSTTLTSYASTSNNNCLYAGTPGANNLIMYDGTNSYSTFASYITAVAPRDAASFSVNPPFINVATTPYDLHINTTIATQCESGGTVVSTPIAITNDFDGNSRSASTPDVGADEFVGIPFGVLNPGATISVISSTSINVAFTLNPSLNNVVIVWNNTGTFTDPSGVPPSAGNPFAGGTVLYYGTSSPQLHSSLTSGTAYYYKLFSYDGSNYSSGVTGNGTTFDFPTVTSTAATNILYTTATTGGNVTNSGYTTITERGVCYSLNLNPTTSDSKVTAAGTTGAYSCNLSSLTMGTTYHFRAYAINSVGTSYGSDLTFTTGAPISTFPYLESFSATIPSYWSASEGVAGASYHWAPTTADATHGASAPYYGTHFMYLYVFLASTSYNPYYLTTPQFQLGASAYDLSYYYFLGANGYTTTPVPMEIEISSNGGANWTSLYQHTNVNSTFSAWTLNTISLSAYSNQTVTIRYKSNSNYGSSICDQGLDEVSITAQNVVNPTAFTATAISSSQIDLGWALNPSLNDVMLVYNTTNTFGTPVNGTVYNVSDPIPGGGTVLQNNTNTTYSHTSLSPNTTYYYKAYSKTSHNNYSTGVSANATTPCGTISSFPYNETFAATLNTCWNISQVAGSGNWAMATTMTYPTLTPQNGTHMAYFNSYSFSAGVSSRLKTQTFNFTSLANPQVEFYMTQDAAYSANNDRVEVQVSTNNGVNWTTVGSAFPRYNAAYATAGWELKTSSLSAYAGLSNVVIGFLATSEYGNNLSIDNVTVKEGPTTPVFSVSPTSKAYGSVTIGGGSVDQIFTITNTGAGTLTITSGRITLTGSDPGQFNLYDNNSYPINLLGGQSASVSVQFAPTSLGAKTANLNIIDNTGNYDVPLTGTGILNAPQTLTGSTDVNYKPVLNWSAPLAENEIKLDDGTAEQNMWVGSPSTTSQLFYNKLVAPHNGTVSQISFYAYATSAGIVFNSVMLCPDDGTGKPNLAAPWVTFSNVAVPTTISWINLALSTPQSVTLGQVFYIVTQWPAGSTTGPYIGTDNTVPCSRSYWTQDGGVSWNSWAGNFIMRAYLGTYTDAFTSGVAPIESKSLPVGAVTVKKQNKDVNSKSNIEEKQISVPVANLYVSNKDKAFTSYTLKRGTTTGVYDQTFTGLSGTTYTDNSALSNTNYYYVVVAEYPEGSSPNSNEVNVGTFNWNYGNNALTGNDLYYFANSTSGASGSPSKPEYGWIDPVASGHTEIISTAWTSGDADDGYFLIPDIGFNYIYFGNSYRTNVYIGSNGYVSFGAGSGNTTPYALPNASAPLNSIIGALYDLDSRTATYSDAHIYYGSYDNKFVVTWMHSHQYGSATVWITFQIALVNDGLAGNSSYLINYNDDQTSTYTSNFIVNNCAVGLNNIDGSKGLNYRYLTTRGTLFNTGGKGIGAMSLGAGPNSGSLPVNMKTFTSSVNLRDVTLMWATEKEQNNKGFEVMRSKFGEDNYTSLGFVNSKGNQNSQSNYEFTDKKLNVGKYNYKLKQIDNNGNYKYYQLNNFVEISAPKKYNLSQNYPNPFNPTTKIDFDLPFDSKVRITVFDMLGREVKTLVSGETKLAGFYTIELNAATLASGTYFYRMIANGQDKDYIFTKKMVVIK